LNRFGVTHECERQTDRQTDGRTNILVADAALSYGARPKTFSCVVLINLRPHNACTDSSDVLGV